MNVFVFPLESYDITYTQIFMLRNEKIEYNNLKKEIKIAFIINNTIFHIFYSCCNQKFW
jgi:hypothetical protein